MTSFGWKRKCGDKVNTKTSHAFEENASEDKDEEVDWLEPVPKRIAMSLEDATLKVARLKQEGETLATAERYWEAIKKWDEALQLNPDNGTLYELKAQAYSQVGELLPSLAAAQKAVELAPMWWAAHQTMARSLLGLGEVSMAARRFGKACMLNPGEAELWEEDIPWVLQLLQHKSSHDEANSAEETPLVEVDDTEQSLVPVNTASSHITPHVQWEEQYSEKTLTKLPTNYVFLRN